MTKFKFQIPNRKSGQIMITTTVFLVLLSGVVLGGMVGPAVSATKNSNNVLTSLESYLAAESGTEDVLYRLKNGLDVDEEEVLTIGQATVTTSITDTLNGKTISSESNSGDYIRKVEAGIVEEEGVDFNYALQSGNGGFYMSGGGIVNGNVYSNGDIIGASGVTITGSATAASNPAVGTDQTNSTPLPPTYNIVFGNTSSNPDFAQSFQVSEDGSINKIRLYLKRTASAPGNLNIKLTADNAGVPATTVIDSVTLSSNLVATSYGWVDVVLGSYAPLKSSKTYWLVLDGGNPNSSKYYTIGGNQSYALGQAKIGKYSTGPWNNTSPAGLDGYFEIYLGGPSSKIEGENGSQWSQPLNVTGDSWAQTVKQTNTSGTIYCESSVNNAPAPGGKPCNTSRGLPPPQGFPISEANIESWKAEVDAIVDGSGSWEQSNTLSVNYLGLSKSAPFRVNGNLTLGCSSGNSSNFTDLYVTGNLSITSDCTVNVTGVLKVGGTFSMSGGENNILKPAKTVWIVGNVTFSTNKIVLHPSYGTNSGVILSDGKISLGGSIKFYGSGQSGSYPILVTTSACPYEGVCSGGPAFDVAGSAGAVVVVAPNGVLQLAGGSGVKSMAAHRIVISGSGTINYDSGLADITLNSGPSGGWEVTGWGEVE